MLHISKIFRGGALAVQLLGTMVLKDNIRAAVEGVITWAFGPEHLKFGI